MVSIERHARELDDRANRRQRGARVNLGPGDVQIPDVQQRIPAHVEVIQRESTAELLQAANHRLGVHHAYRRRLFRELHRDAALGQRGGPQLVRKPGDEGVVGERLSGDEIINPMPQPRSMAAYGDNICSARCVTQRSIEGNRL